MTKKITKDVLSGLDSVYKDLLTAAHAYRKGYELGWDDDTWTCMAYNIKEGMDHIKNLECQITDMGWELNPDRMGQ